MDCKSFTAGVATYYPHAGNGTSVALAGGLVSAAVAFPMQAQGKGVEAGAGRKGMVTGKNRRVGVLPMLVSRKGGTAMVAGS